MHRITPQNSKKIRGVFQIYENFYFFFKFKQFDNLNSQKIFIIELKKNFNFKIKKKWLICKIDSDDNKKKI